MLLEKLPVFFSKMTNYTKNKPWVKGIEYKFYVNKTDLRPANEQTFAFSISDGKQCSNTVNSLAFWSTKPLKKMAS